MAMQKAGHARWWIILCAIATVNLRAGEQWFAIRTPHFCVLTTGSRSRGQWWARQFETFRLGLQQVFPAEAGRLQPVTIVLFQNQRQFKPYALLRKGKVARIGGYFARAQDTNLIALPVDDVDENTRLVVFHEATHWYLSAAPVPVPSWLNEGIAEVYSTFASGDDDHFQIGHALPWHVHFLRTGHFVPLARIIATSPHSLAYNDDDRTGQFYAESWLFVHWVLFGLHSPGPASLSRYLQLQAAGQPEDTAFAAAFGGSHEEVTRRCEKYLDDGSYVQLTCAVKDADRPKLQPAELASEAEVALALGWLKSTARGEEEALPLFQRAVERAPDSVPAWEALGYTELALQQRDAALTAFDHACAGGSTHALVWHNRAALRMGEAAGADVIVHTEDGTDFAPAAADWRHALDLDPACEPAYAGLAGIVYATEPFDPEDVARMERGHRRFPDNADIAVGLASVLLRTSRRSEGLAALQAMLAKGDLSGMHRRAAEDVAEHEQMKELERRLRDLFDRKNYPAAKALAEETLKQDLSASARAFVMKAARQADLFNRVDAAVDLLNQGKPGEARAMLEALHDKFMAPMMRHEVDRLIAACSAAAPAGP